MMDELDWKRVVNKNLERSNELLTEELGDFYNQLFDICEPLRNTIHEGHMQLDKKTLGRTADLAILGALIRFTANWSLRLSDKTTKEHDWQMTPDQAKHLVLDFFSQLYDDELDQEQRFLKEQVSKFLEVFKKSKMVKAVGDKADIFKEELKQTSEELEK